MDTAFVKRVTEVTELIRKRDMLKLGKHPLARLRVVLKQAGRDAAHTDVYLGRILRDLVIEIIETQMRPSGEERLDRIDWRQYLILKRNIVRDDPWRVVADDLAIGQAAFFEAKRAAIEHLANELWALEEATLLKPETPHNLPTREREFVPRVDDEGRNYVDKIVDQLLTKRSHLVSIRGIGGAGKTTLALEVAYRCVEAGYFDIVIWTTAQERRLELSGRLVPVAKYVTSIDGILDTIGKAFNERKVLTLGRDDRLALVKNLLSSRDCLIVIDSTEELSGEANREIHDFVRDVPYPTKVLLTSRLRESEDRLEWVNILGGMHQNEALQFIHNEYVSRGISWISKEEMLEIHRITDGLPLAMQLVIGEMGVTGRSAGEVVQTTKTGEALLSYLFERAYKQLDLTTRKILHVMPIFAVPVPADTISAASGAEGFQLLDALAALHSRFLVNRDEAKRYDCPETVKIYIRQMEPVARLDDQSGAEFLAQAYQRLACEYHHRLRNQQGLGFLKEQRENVLAVMEWCYQNEKWQLVIDLMSVLGRPLGVLGYWNERIEWGQLAIEACRRSKEQACEAWFAIHDVGWTYLLKGEKETGDQWIREGLDLAGRIGNRKAEAMGLRNLGWIAYRMDEDYEEALRYAEDSLALWEQLEEEDLYGTAMAKSLLGKAKYKLGRTSGDQEFLLQARELLEEVLETRKTLGEVEDVAETLSDLALVALAQGDEAKAKRLSDQSKTKAEQLPEPAEAHAYALKCRGEVEKELDNIEEARYYFQEALRIYEKLGAQWAVEYVQRKLRELEQGQEATPVSQA